MCRPCREFCRGNSDVCLSKDEHRRAVENPNDYSLERDHVSSLGDLFSLYSVYEDLLQGLSPSLYTFASQIEQWATEGPTEDNAVCVSCQNNSVGDKCESCLSGYFLLQGKCEK